jgi:hypothetical protein
MKKKTREKKKFKRNLEALQQSNQKGFLKNKKPGRRVSREQALFISR